MATRTWGQDRTRGKAGRPGGEVEGAREDVRGGNGEGDGESEGEDAEEGEGEGKGDGNTRKMMRVGSSSNAIASVRSLYCASRRNPDVLLTCHLSLTCRNPFCRSPLP